MDYNRRYFDVYVLAIIMEMKKRDIKYQYKYHDEISLFCMEDKLITGVLHYSEHNERYLKQCYYNLQEKFDRGIISKEEWLKIENKVQINNYNINTIDEFLNEDFSMKLPSLDEIEIIE